MPRSINSNKQHYTECEVLGKRQRYDMCKDDEGKGIDPKKWIDLYNKSTKGAKYAYITSGLIWYCDGVKCNSTSVHHFFRMTRRS